MKKKKIAIITAVVVCVFAVGVGAFAINNKSRRADKIVEAAKENVKKGNVEEAKAQNDKALDLDKSNEAAKKMDEAINKYYEISELYDRGKLDEVEVKLNDFNKADYDIYFEKFDEVSSKIREKKQKLDDVKDSLVEVAKKLDLKGKADEISQAIDENLSQEQIDRIKELVELLNEISDSASDIIKDTIKDIIEQGTNEDGKLELDKIKDEIENSIDKDKLEDIKDSISDKIDQDKIDNILDKDKIDNIVDKDKVDSIKDKVNGIINRN